MVAVWWEKEYGYVAVLGCGLPVDCNLRTLLISFCRHGLASRELLLEQLHGLKMSKFKYST